MLAQILEAAMLLCFGLSWPLNAYKSYKAATAAGSSWQFIALITVGYFAGIGAKFASGDVSWVLAVYFINLLFLCANWWVYFRNVRLDRAADDLFEMDGERRPVAPTLRKTHLHGAVAPTPSSPPEKGSPFNAAPPARDM
ncbi:hypothetical protein [Curtanaerobium respiraculi]|uniref:hypothetical protein n=1 Tax=Curtanaerobium respiraculi TaxID=2949669 RepID=UPI0024B3509B|nr:hypothetical protein [Curtanaerobium respiraculi]